MFNLGDYNAQCDRCGMKRKASTMALDWKNMFVCPECYEIRHPQDFVKGVPDDQTVPISRPAIVQSVGETTLSSSVSANAMTISLTSVTGLREKDTIGVSMDNGLIHWTYIDTMSGTTITMGSYIPYASASGNTVYLPSISNETFITATSISATGL